MFRIHGTRWVQAGSRLHRTVSRQVLLINGEVFDFFVGLLVPCTRTSPSLGLTKYASAVEIRSPRWQATRGGRREMRDLCFLFFLCLANECLSSLFLLCLLCLAAIFTGARVLCASYYPWESLFQKFRLWTVARNPPLAAPSLLTSLCALHTISIPGKGCLRR